MNSPRRSATACRTRCPARSPPRSRPPPRDAARRRGARAGGAAVAGLRLLRPVPEFRAARRCLPRARPRARRHHQPEGRPPDGQPRRSHRSSPSGGGPSTDTCSAASSSLMLGGVVLSLAGSPPVAERLGYDSFHFVKRHVAFFLPALAVMIATSFLTPRQARRDGADRAGRRARAHAGDAVRRRRGQGRAPLDQPRRHVAAALRVHEAGLRRHRRLAVCREAARAPTFPATSSP